MLVFFTQGVGMYFGYWIAFAHFARDVTKYEELTAAITASGATQSLSFMESMMKMFSVEALTVDPQLLAETMAQWRSFWFVPAGMAAAIALIFFVAFWDKMSNYAKADDAAGS
jgi:hypothetical protein